MRLLPLVASLLLATAAHADLIPSQFGVAIIGGAGYVTSGGTIRGSAYLGAPYSPGDYFFDVSLSRTTVTFQVEDQYTGPGVVGPLRTVLFFGPVLTDPITSFTLDPSSTIKGIVPSTSVALGIIPGSYESNISFDFTNANVFPLGTATFDLSFAPQASAPEIDPSLATSGLALLAGAITILRTRRRRRLA